MLRVCFFAILTTDASLKAVEADPHHGANKARLDETRLRKVDQDQLQSKSRDKECKEWNLVM